MANGISLKQRLKRGDVVFGPWCVIPSATVMSIVAVAGFDFAIIDLEHGPASFETAEEMVRAAQSEGVSPIIRLGRIDEEQILKSLDIGADGVLVAHVESAEDAREVVALAKYHPGGRRGFSPFTRAGRYSGGDVAGHAARQNEQTLVGVILEGERGLANLDAVLGTELLDLVYVGAYDLSQALGMPGQVGHPAIRATMDACVRRIRAGGKVAGGHVARTADDMAWMVDMGMQFVTYLPDCAVLHGALRTAVEDFRTVAGRGRPGA